MAEEAQEAREDAEAAQAAARAAAEAERAAAQRKLDEEKKRQLQEQQQAGVITAEKGILGIPQEYVLYGGLGLGAVGLVALVISLVK